MKIPISGLLKAMRSARLKFLFLFLLSGALLLSSQAFAAEENLGFEQLKTDLEGIKARLATIEEQQKEILAKEDKILTELDRVRIWVHKR